MRLLFLTIFIISFTGTFAQTTRNKKDSTSGMYMNAVQEFVSKTDKLNFSLEEKKDRYYNYIESFIINHPKDELSYWVISLGLDLNLEEITALINLVDSSIKNSPQRSLALMTLKRVTIAESGKPFPALALKDSSGNLLDIASFKGKVVLIDVWSSWCAPCRAAIPGIKKIYKKYKEKGLEVIGVSMDENKNAWLKAIHQDKQTWPAYCELVPFTDNSFRKRFEIYGIPASYLIDQNGILVGQDMSEEAISHWLSANHN